MSARKLLEFIITIGSLILLTVVAILESHRGDEIASEPIVLEEQPLVEVEPEEPVINVTWVVHIVVPPEIIVDEYECELLAHLIYAEAGSDWCSDKLQLYTGSVVLNRVKHKDYPDTLPAVVYQKGQYSCTWNGMIDYEYNERAYDCAKYLLTHGSQIPENVVYQANFKQGDGVYEEFEGMYFCYKGEK